MPMPITDEAAAEHAAEHVPRRGSEGDADADLAASAASPNGSSRRRCRPRPAPARCTLKTPSRMTYCRKPCVLLRGELLDQLHVGDRVRRIQLLRPRRCAPGSQSSTARVRADDERHVLEAERRDAGLNGRQLRVRHVHAAAADRDCGCCRTDVGDDADDLPRLVVVELDRDRLADWILVRPVALRHRLADERDRRARERVQRR